MSAPFFIVGCGRSGTSLLRGLLNRHPEVAIPLESLFIVDYLRAARRTSTADLLPMLVREVELREWGLAPTLEDLGEVQTIGEAIGRLHELYAQSRGKRRWGQKTPRFVRHLELLLEHFPDARFIHMVRDPRAVSSSLIRSDVHRSNALYAARRWRMDVKAGLRFENEHPFRVLRVSYEELVSDELEALDRICEFLELESEGQWRTSAPGSEEYSAFYDRIHAKLDQQTTDEYVDRWKQDLSRREMEVVESVVGELLGQVGYEPMTTRRKVSRLERWGYTWGRAIGLLLQAGKYLRYRPRYLLHLLWRKWKLGLFWEWIWKVNY